MTHLPIDDIRPTSNPLRQVNQRSVEFEELKDSIQACGLLCPLLVRDVGNGRYEVVDGMHRFTAAQCLGLTSLPCVIRTVSDDELLRLQIECNAHTLATSPVDYARRLRAILRRQPQLTQAELGRLLHKSAAWVRDTLGLLRLAPPVAKCVERGEVPLKSAYLLAQLSRGLQQQYLKDAMFQKASAFDAFIRPIILTSRKPDDAAPLIHTFDPKPYLRNLKQITAEIADPAQAPAVLAAEGVDNLLDAFLVALKWVIHTDILSIRKYEHEHRSRQAARQL